MSKYDYGEFLFLDSYIQLLGVYIAWFLTILAKFSL